MSLSNYSVAFIGLGNMGGPMAANLLKANAKVCVFDLVPQTVSELKTQGARAAASAEEAVKGADIVISMLPAGKHVLAVLFAYQLMQRLPLVQQPLEPLPGPSLERHR